MPEASEVLKLGPPAAGEVRIYVDGSKTQTGFSMGTETLLPGAELPTHRHLDRHEAFFIAKGQGRVTVAGRTTTVVPGTVVVMPRQTWLSLRNTGTGLLQFAWTASPPGIEKFFREVSALGANPAPASLQEVATRHGIELAAVDQVTAAKTPHPGRRRRRRHSPAGSTAVLATPQAPLAVAPLPPARPQAPRSPRPPRPQVQGRSSSRGPARRDHAKEVYMGGRWIQVSGPGPVIAPGRSPVEDPRRRRP